MHDTAQVLELFGKDPRVHNVVLYNLGSVRTSVLKTQGKRIWNDTKETRSELVDATYENFNGPCNHVSSLGVDHRGYLPAGRIASGANGRSIESLGFGWSTASLCFDPESKGRANTKFRGDTYQIVRDAC